MVPRSMGAPTTTARFEVRRLTRLATPIILANLCWMLVGTVDIAMLGRVSPEAVAAAALASVWVHSTQMLGMGIVMGIDPEVTQGYGARDRALMGHALQRGIAVAVVASIPVIALRFLTGEFLLATRDVAAWLVEASGRPPEDVRALDLERYAALAGPAETYALAQSFAEPAFLVFAALRQYLQGRGILRPALLVGVVGNVFNVAANALLIFGLDLGLLGAGLATGLTRLFVALALLWLVRRARLLRGGWVPWSRAALTPARLFLTVRRGVPVGLHFAFEIGAFGATTLLAGLLGVVATNAHAFAINVSSMTFMVPLGFALAATTRVGNLVGERRHQDAQLATRTAVALGGLTMAALGVLLFALREWIPRAYTTDPAVVALTASVIPIAAVFQLPDGIQVVGAGALRGMGRTAPAAVFNFVAWWVIALPLAAYLVVLRPGGDLRDIWTSLLVGLGIVAALMLAYLRKRGPASLDDTAVRSR